MCLATGARVWCGRWRPEAAMAVIWIWVPRGKIWQHGLLAAGVDDSVVKQRRWLAVVWVAPA